ncbi:MAG: hypothetical protein ACREF4_02455 [Gammaproteobacteria bacterium]
MTRFLDWIALRAEYGVVTVFATAVGLFALWASIQVATAHDWYTGLEDRHGTSCCGGRDCKPYQYRRTEGGLAYEALMPDGSWLPIPVETILPMSPPTEPERIHVCCTGGHCRDHRSTVRCSIIPGFGA